MVAIDRRVRRTYRLLGDALLALIREKGYGNVTIKDITDRADVAYVTFFRHFDDIDELLLHTLDGVINEVIELIQSAVVDPDDLELCLKIEGRIIFEHAQQNHKLYETMVHEQINLKTYRAIRKRIANALIHDGNKGIQARQHLAIPEDSLATLPLPIHLVSNHSASAILSLLEWWLHNDMPFTPAEMGDYFAKLISMPVNQVIAELIGLSPEIAAMTVTQNNTD